ncbi:MAG: hypothetical protein ACE363_13415 [Alphaproteobacteria bacterium]
MTGEPETTDKKTDADVASNALRRKLLKAGGAAVPLMVSLQSGTAWAISSCADNIARPDASDLGDIFGIIAGDSTVKQNNRDFVSSVTGLPVGPVSGDDDCDDDDSDPNDLQTLICECDGLSTVGNYPAANDSVEACEVTHLLVTNASCWASYCDGPLSGSGSVAIDNDTTPSVCSGP